MFLQDKNGYLLSPKTLKAVKPLKYKSKREITARVDHLGFCYSSVGHDE